MTKYILLSLCVISLFSCSKEEDINATPTSAGLITGKYDPTYIIPKSFPSLIPMKNPSYNLMTAEGVRLGKKLYTNPVLGTNGLSCSYCHINEYSYSIPMMRPSGLAVLTHQNLGWYDSYGWFGEEGNSLDDVALLDLAEGNIFLNSNSDSILNRFNRDLTYQQLFWEAFGVKIVELSVPERNQYTSYAIAQFMRTMFSDNSKFDKYLKGEVPLTFSEINGFTIFMDDDKGDCFHCHGNPSNPLWTDGMFHNNALDSVFIGNNQGRFLISGNIFDMGKFRTPTLRNIELSAPYMHDNRFNTLEEVVDFYSDDLKNSPYVDPLMQKIGQGGVHLTPPEKVDLIVFLKTLTDTTFINNPNFQ